MIHALRGRSGVRPKERFSLGSFWQLLCTVEWGISDSMFLLGVICLHLFVILVERML